MWICVVYVGVHNCVCLSVDMSAVWIPIFGWSLGWLPADVGSFSKDHLEKLWHFLLYKSGQRL